MPKTNHSVQVKAPVETLWSLLLDKVKNPDRYLPGVTELEMLEPQPGLLTRRMKLEGLEIVEHVTPFERQHEVDAVLVEHPLYAGQAVDRIEPPLRPGLAATLTLSLDWRRRDRAPDTLDLSGAIRQAAERLKALAEGAEGV